MTANIPQAKDLIARCRSLRGQGQNEAVLRGEFQSRLRLVFPDIQDATWLNHYAEGAEAHTKIATAGGATASRFIDTLIGSTTIEYEADLRNEPRRAHGEYQVQEHVAGLVRAGIPVSQIRGVLSDTVDWYAYDAKLTPDADPENCGPDDIVLALTGEMILEAADTPTAERFVEFIRNHLAREQSRPLTAYFIASDLGLESLAYARHEDALAQLVNNRRAADATTELATDLWSRFVDHLEGADTSFRAQAYVDEAYIAVLARLLFLAATSLLAVLFSATTANSRTSSRGSFSRIASASQTWSSRIILAGSSHRHIYLNSLQSQGKFSEIYTPTTSPELLSRTSSVVSWPSSLAERTASFSAKSGHRIGSQPALRENASTYCPRARTLISLTCAADPEPSSGLIRPVVNSLPLSFAGEFIFEPAKVQEVGNFRPGESVICVAKRLSDCAYLVFREKKLLYSWHSE